MVNLVPRPEGVEAWQASLLEPLAVGLEHRRPAADHARRDGARARSGPDRARPDAAVRAVRSRTADRHRRPGRAVRGVARLRGDRLHQRRQTDVKQAVADLTGGAGADIVIETSGFPASSAIVLDVVRKEGKVAHIGWANDLPPLPVIPIMAKTLTVFGVGGNGGRGQYERSLELVRSRPGGPRARW